jgi:hypothetical protein
MLAIGHGAGTRNTGAQMEPCAVSRSRMWELGEWARVRALGIAGRGCPDARMRVPVRERAELRQKARCSSGGSSGRSSGSSGSSSSMVRGQ